MGTLARRNVPNKLPCKKLPEVARQTFPRPSSLPALWMTRHYGLLGAELQNHRFRG